MNELLSNVAKQISECRIMNGKEPSHIIINKSTFKILNKKYNDHYLQIGNNIFGLIPVIENSMEDEKVSFFNESFCLTIAERVI